MNLAILALAPILVAGEITEETIELRAFDIPDTMDVVMFRPIDADIPDSLRAPTGDQPYLGYGALATLGPTSQDTVWVTNTADSGMGTLRYHLETAPASDAVVAFDPGVCSVDDVIELESPITVGVTNTIIDGLTAKRAVTIMQQDSLSAVFIFDGSEVAQGSFDTVLRGLRIYQGGPGGAVVENTADGVHLAGTANKIVIDHCEFGPARDEAIGFAGSQQWITVQWCTFHDVLKTFLLGASWSRTSVHHNFFYRNGERLVLAQGYPTHPGMLEYRNNVVFDWHTRGMEFREGAGGNMVGNVYLAGTNTTIEVAGKALRFEDDQVRDLVYTAYNLFPPEELDLGGRKEPRAIDVDLGQHPAAFVPTTDAHTAVFDVLSEAGVGPYRSETDKEATRIAFIGTKVDSLLEWIPKAEARDVAYVGPNRRVSFDCRAYGGLYFTPSSTPIEVWTLAATPPPPQVTLVGPELVRVVVSPGENPSYTELALAAGPEVSWLEPGGTRVQDPYFAPAATWNAGPAFQLTVEESLLRVVARNGEGILTTPVDVEVLYGTITGY